MEQIEQVKIIPRRLISDERGWFLKAITGKKREYPNIPERFILPWVSRDKPKEDIIIPKR
mgnify:CR=1 FL=1